MSRPLRRVAVTAAGRDSLVLIGWVYLDRRDRVVLVVMWNPGANPRVGYV